MRNFSDKLGFSEHNLVCDRFFSFSSSTSLLTRASESSPHWEQFSPIYLHITWYLINDSPYSCVQTTGLWVTMSIWLCILFIYLWKLHPGIFFKILYRWIGDYCTSSVTSSARLKILGSMGLSLDVAFYLMYGINSIKMVCSFKLNVEERSWNKYYH